MSSLLLISSLLSLLLLSLNILLVDIKELSVETHRVPTHFNSLFQINLFCHITNYYFTQVRGTVYQA